MILAHKSDLLKAGASSATTPSVQAINRVKTILERELEKRRASQAGGVGVEGLGAEGEGSDLGGLECSGSEGAFRFAEWEGGDVEFLGTFVKVGAGTDDEKTGDGVGLEAFREWMDEIS
jgi:signal recognition particle receptor subunit beta